MTQAKPYPLWVSHSSMGDFLSCHRAYFLKHIYKDPKTGRKISLINPSLSLGIIVHDVLESLSGYKAEERFKESLIDTYEKEWEKVTGKLGGFTSPVEEAVFKERGLKMIKRVIDNPGPLANKTLKLQSPDSLPPRYMISTTDNILLCGKVDWLEYFPEDDSIHIIDFKTGTHEEKTESLQLPIYALLVKNCQKRNIRKMSYWYLERDNQPTEMPLPSFQEAYERVMHVALQVKAIRQAKEYNCSRNGCYACKPLESIINGHAEFIKTSGYQDIYIV